MGQLTAVSIGDKTLGVASGRAAAKGVELTRAATVALPEDAAARAAAIRDALAGERRVALVVPRSMAVVREFTLPPGEPEEVAQMVRFQLEKELPLPLDQVRYATVQTAADGKLHVTAVAVPREPLDEWIKRFGEAGCAIPSVYVSSFGLASLAPSADGGSALISLAGGTAEILILDGTAVALSRSAPVADPAGDALATEVDRTILAYAARSGGKEVKRVLVAGEGEPADRLCEGLKKRLNRDVTRLSFNGDISRRKDVAIALESASAAGAVVAALGGRAMPDVLRPPSTARRFRLTPRHRVAILGTLVAILGFAWAEMWLGDQQTGLDALQREVSALKPKYDAVVRLEEDTKLVQKWSHGHRHNWLNSLYVIQSKIDTKNLYVLSMTLDDQGIFTMTGKCVANDTVNDLIGELSKAKLVTGAKPSFNAIPGASGKFRTAFSVSATLVGFESDKKAPGAPRKK